MEKFKTLNETELISVVGGKSKKKRSLCPYVATGMAVAGGIFTGGNPFGVAGGWATAFATPFCN